MSGTYPVTFPPAKVKFDTFEPSLASNTQSLKRFVTSRGGQRWYVKLTYGPASEAEWAPLDAFLVDQAGQSEKFTLVVPGRMKTPRGVMAGVPLVDGAVAAGQKSVPVKGMTAGALNVWRQGDFVKFANHYKVYKVTADLNADGAGKGALSIAPALAAALVNNEAITYSNVPMRCALITDRFGVEYKGGMMTSGFEIEVVEDPYA